MQTDSHNPHDFCKAIHRSFGLLALQTDTHDTHVFCKSICDGIICILTCSMNYSLLVLQTDLHHPHAFCKAIPDGILGILLCSRSCSLLALQTESQMLMHFAKQFIMASFELSLTAAGATICLCCKLIHMIQMHFASDGIFCILTYGSRSNSLLVFQTDKSHNPRM
jgi:hypothetical protein